MRTWIVILCFLISGARLIAEPEAPLSHQEAAPAPTASESPAAPGTASPRALSPRDRLVQELWGLRLGSAAIDELVKVLQKPADVATAEKFQAAIDKWPKNTLTPEQRAKLLEWFAQGLQRQGPVEKRADDIAFAAKKVQAENRAMLAAGNHPPPPGGGAPAPTAAHPSQFEQSLKAQLSELQSKVDKALTDRREPTPRAGRESSDLLDKLIANLDKPSKDGGATPAPAPTPPEFHPTPPAHENAVNKNQLPERDGLRFPPREDPRDRRRGENGGFNGNGNGNGNGGGDGKDKEKKDEQKKGESPFGKGKSSRDEYTPKKAPTPASTPTPFATPAPEAEAASAEPAPGAPIKVSDLPLTSAPGGRGGAYNPPPFLGGGGGGYGGGGGAGPMGGGLSGEPPAVGLPDYGGGGYPANARPVAVGYASGGGVEGGEGGEPTSVDEAPSRENVPSSTRLRPQILEQRAGGEERHWIFDSAGTMVRQLVCEGIDADKVEVCRTMKIRAKLRQEKALAAGPKATSTPASDASVLQMVEPESANWQPSLGYVQ